MLDIGSCDPAARILLGLAALLFLLGLVFCFGSVGYFIAVARSARKTLRSLESLRVLIAEVAEHLRSERSGRVPPRP